MAEDDGKTKRGSRTVRLRPGATILLCGKCLKRHGDAKAMRRAVKAGAKASAEPGRKRKVRVATVGCLGLCPRRAVVVASAAGLAAGEVMLVRETADVAAALPRLL